MTENLAAVVERFVEHKRALGRKYHSEEHELRLLVRFAEEHGAGNLHQLTPVLFEDFLASRPRNRPRSFNHLLGAIRCFLDWAVTLELLSTSPLRARRRRVTSGRVPFLFDTVQARRLLEAAAALPDNPGALDRGSTYRTIFALCYGPGLRAGEACGLRLGDVDSDRGLLVVRGGKFGKSRLVPHGPRVGHLVSQQVERRLAGHLAADVAHAPLFTFDGNRRIHPCSASQIFDRLVPTLDLTIPGTGSRRHDCMTFATRSPSGACSDGIGRASTHRVDCISCRPSWVMSIDGRLPDHHPWPVERSEPQVRSLRRAGVGRGGGMTEAALLGPILHSFFIDHVITVKGLRPSSVRSYRDTVRLFLQFVAKDKRRKMTRLALNDLTFERVVAFLRHLEIDRGNHIRTRNQWLAAVHCLFEYIPGRTPEMLGVCQRVAAIPMKRAAPAETHFLERDEVEDLYVTCPAKADSPCATEPSCSSSTTPAPACRRRPISASSTSTWGSTP